MRLTPINNLEPVTQEPSQDELQGETPSVESTQETTQEVSEHQVLQATVSSPLVIRALKLSKPEVTIVEQISEFEVIVEDSEGNKHTLGIDCLE